MPRKRASAANVGDEGSAAKRVKTEPAVALVTRWEWENDGNKWTAYSEVVSKDMTAAMTAGYEIVVLQLPKGVKMKVLFERMVQKNKVTGWERRVRCCVNDSADTNGGYYIWEWEDEKGAWNPYSASVAMDLEKARAGGDTTLSFTACRRKYTIDITKLKQSNDDTGVERTVRRHKSGAVLPDPSVEVELIETSGAGSSTNGAATTSTRSSGRGATAAAAKSGAAATATTSTAKSGATKSGKSGAAKSARVKSEPGEPEVKTVLLCKGKAPVDPQCPKQTTSHVYSEGNDIYDVMLNQTNVQNNNNKFFIIQLLQDDARKAFSVWFRWGRVGLNGQNNLVACGPDLDEAKQIFCKKFADKTKNDWPDRKRFTKVAGKYDLVHIDYSVKPNTIKREPNMEEESNDECMCDQQRRPTSPAFEVTVKEEPAEEEGEDESKTKSGVYSESDSDRQKQSQDGKEIEDDHSGTITTCAEEVCETEQRRELDASHTWGEGNEEVSSSNAEEDDDSGEDQRSDKTTSESENSDDDNDSETEHHMDTSILQALTGLPSTKGLSKRQVYKAMKAHSQKQRDEDTSSLLKEPNFMTCDPDETTEGPKRRQVALRYQKPEMYLPVNMLRRVMARENRDHLTYEEYMVALTRMAAANYRGKDTLKLLLNHLAAVAQDAWRFDWSAVYDFSGKFLDILEDGRATWKERRAPTPTEGPMTVFESRMAYSFARYEPKDPRPCHKYNSAVCGYGGIHVDGNAVCCHTCSICWYSRGERSNMHPATTCPLRTRLTET